MRTHFLGSLLVAGCTFTLAMPALAGTTAPQTDIARLVAEAAAYQPGQSRQAFRRLEELVRGPSSDTRKELEAGLVKLLSPSCTYEAREFACTQLGITGSKSALPALSNMLKSDETAGIACVALTTYPPGGADKILRAALPSAQGRARIQIITTLGDRRDTKAVKLLEQLTRDADVSVATAALASLGKIGDEAAWKAINSVPENDYVSLGPAVIEAKLRCAEGFAQAGNAKAALPVYEDLLAGSLPDYLRRAALDALIRLDKDHAQQRILQVLHSSDAALKPVAIANVRNLLSGNASEVFSAELPKLQAQEQAWLIDSLAVRGDAPACAAIGNSLGSREAVVRRAAIGALGRMGDTWSVTPLARALAQARDAEERRAIESALIRLRGGGPTDMAITAALKESSGNTRADLITVLARRQGPVANPLLLAEAGQTNPVVAKAALRALGKTAGEKEVSPLLELLTRTHDDGVRSEAASATAQAIARIGKPARRSTLVCGALKWGQNVESRIALLGLLPGCGDAAALAAVRSTTADSDRSVRDAAIRALADWPDASAWEALVGIYREPGGETARGLALRGLVRLAGEGNAHPDAKLVERYRQLLADAHGDVELRLILGALGGAAQPGALELALPLLDNQGVRAEAEVAVKKIAEAIKAQHPQAAQAALKRLRAKP